MADKVTDYTDKDLLELFRSEERKEYAFNLIVRRYQERLYWHIRRILIDHDDTDDILQNTFIKAWNGLETFRALARLR